MVYSKNNDKSYIKYSNEDWERTGDYILAKNHGTRDREHNFYVILPNGKADIMTDLEFDFFLKTTNLQQVAILTERDVMALGRQIAADTSDLSDLA